MDPSCLSRDELDRVFKIDCFQKERDVFEKVHYSSSFQFKDPERAEMSTVEDWLTESLWAQGIQERVRIGEYIRPIVIWGAQGTGKTELCRWLEFNISHPSYKTKRITKRELAMGGILGIAQGLTGHEIDLGTRLMSRQAGVGAEDAAIYALGHMIDQGKIAIEFEDKDMVLQMLRDIIRKNIEERVETVRRAKDISKIETTLRFIKPRDLAPLKQYYNVDFAIDKVNKQIYRALTPFIANVDDVSRLMFEYIRENNDKGKIPVLIFDDVTHLGDLVDDFISVITDISKGEEGYICDFVIGTTTGFYLSKFRDRLASTAKARIYEIKFSPEEEGERNHANWLLGEKGLSHFLDFVLRYVNAVRVCKGCENCTVELFIEQDNNYFPFTKTFLGNLYKRLLYERNRPGRRGIVVNVTPRFIIKLLKACLSDFLESGVPPSRFMDKLLTLDTIDFFVEDPDKKKELHDLLVHTWWYGEHDEKERVSIKTETLTQLDLKHLIPEELQTEPQLTFRVHRVTSEGPSAVQPVRPVSPDEVRLQTLIRAWCRGEESEVPVGPLKSGFDAVCKCFTSYLSGNNDFNNITNPRSSRNAEYIAYLAPGGRTYDYWIGDVNVTGAGPHRIYVMSQYRRSLCEPFAQKGLVFLFLDEDDFFNLYKIGHRRTNEPEKKERLRAFVERRYDKTYEALQTHRRVLRNYFEGQIGLSTEAFVLAAYVFCIKLLQAQQTMYTISNLDDILSFKLDAEKHFQEEWWPGEIKSKIKYLNSILESISDLFLSFFSLRGEGSIMDYPILQKTWSEIENEGGYASVIKAIGTVDDRFILGKKETRVVNTIALLKDLDSLIEELSKEFVKKSIRNELKEINAYVNRLGEPEDLKEQLDGLAEKLKNGFTWERERIERLSKKVNTISASLDKTRKEIQSISNILDKVSSYIDKISVTVLLNRLGEDEAVSISKQLDGVLTTIEDRMGKKLEEGLETLQAEISKFAKMEM